MNRRHFLKLFASAAPVAAVAPTYFFAPVGGWPQSRATQWMSVDYGKGASYAVYWVKRDGMIYTFDGEGTGRHINIPIDQLIAKYPKVLEHAGDNLWREKPWS